jgi:hypothetical protein
MGEKLVQAVQTLQQAILDVHMLFFKPAYAPSTGTADADVAVPGLVILKQLEFICDVDRALSPLLNVPPAAVVGGAAAGVVKSFGFNRSAFLADEKASSSHLDIRKVFDQWIERTVQRVGERARAALEAMESATEVARLQQRVWLCCTTVTTGIVSGPSSAPSTLPEKAAQADWEEACVELLAVKRRRAAKAETNTAVAAASLLWSRVFRLPFMLQVTGSRAVISSSNSSQHCHPDGVSYLPF